MDGRDGCLRGRSQCRCFSDCADITDKEFHKIFELKDTGVALYRYVPLNQDPDNTIGEVYVLRTEDDIELEPDEFTLSLAKNKINCPRCIKLIEKAENSLSGRRLINQQDIAGICDHCWTPVAKMQRLRQVQKKERISAALAVEAFKAQMEQTREENDDETKVPEEIKERPKAAKLRDRNKTKAGDEKRSPKIPEKEDKTSKVNKRGGTEKLKDKSKTKAEEEKRSPKVPEKVKEEKSKVKDVKGKTSANQFTELIASEKLKKMKERQEEENRRKEQEKQKKLTELAEKRAREAELQRQAQAKAPPPTLVQNGSDSDDAPEHGHIVYKALSENEIIIGEKICKNIRGDNKEELDTSRKISTKKINKPEKTRSVEPERKKAQDISKKGPVVDSDKYEKEAPERGSGDKKLALGKEKHKKDRDVETDSLKKGIATESEATAKVPVVGGENVEKVTIKSTQAEAPERRSGDKKLALGKEKHKKDRDVETDSLKKGIATESEAPAKVPVVGGENVEKVTIKSTQDPQTPKATTTSQVSPLHKKNEEGPIRYALSDRTFIEKGWTMLPLEKVVRKMNVYRMRPSRPEFDWFEHHKNKVLQYDTGERLAEVEDSGRGRWYYRSGELAMDYYDAEETNAGQRFVVYSTGAPDARGRPRPRTVLATFDHSGNGIVFDHAGKTRLKYNQTEGIVLDQKIGPVSRWKWHTLNDPPVLQQVMIDTQLSHKDPNIAEMGPADETKIEDEAMLSIELDNSVKEKMKKSSQDYKPFQIKMKALKINENFSLRVLDQASVYLLYRDGSTNLKINIGMLLDHKEIVDTDASEIGEVSMKVEKLPACTASISKLQQTVARARARDAEERSRRTRLTGRPQGGLNDIDSVDALRAAISRPLRTALYTCSASATQDTPKLLKPCSCDLYCKQLS